MGKLRALGDLIAAGRVRLRSRRWQAALAAGALAVVAVSGALRSEPGPVVPGIVVAPELARYSRCPGGPPVGGLEVGDDVLLTGKSADGAWVELRAPGAPTERVWVRARLIEAQTATLPVHDCATEAPTGTEAASSEGAGDGTRSAAAVDFRRDRTRRRPAATTTTTSGPTSAGVPPTTAAPGPGPTTAPSGPDRVGPVVSQLRAGGELPDGPDRIFERHACGPTSIGVEAVAVDSSGIASVRLHWSFPGRTGPVNGSVPMQRSGGRYRATLGAFPAGAAPASGSTFIRWWVEATDTAGNTTRAFAPDDPPADERVELASCPS